MFSLAAQLSSGREIMAPAGFADDVRMLLGRADRAAEALGYGREEVDAARFAAVALVDDVILNSPLGVSLNWAANPLSRQFFQATDAGAQFFAVLDELLQRPEDAPILDLLEVYLTCLLLGFRGQFGRGRDERLRAWREPVIEKLQRVLGRGRRAALASGWRPDAPIRIAPPTRKHARLAASVALAVALLAPVVFGLYALMLGRGASELARLAGR
jgi:type VI secretion system protein ImpK